MSNATEVTEFVLEHLHSAPLLRQARLYRALAGLAPTSAEKRRYIHEAENCEKQHAERETRAGQLLIEFRKEHS